MSDYDYSSDAGETTDGYGEEGEESESGTDAGSDASTDSGVEGTEGESEVFIPSGPEVDTYVGSEVSGGTTDAEVFVPSGPEVGAEVGEASKQEAESGAYVGEGEKSGDEGVYVGEGEKTGGEGVYVGDAKTGNTEPVAEADSGDKAAAEAEKSENGDTTETSKEESTETSKESETEKGEDGVEKVDADEKIAAYLDSLSEEERAKQAAALDKMTAEERAVYAQNLENEPQITATMQEIAEKNGGELQGLEYRMKTPSSTYEKMHEREEETDIKDMNDIIRYTQIYAGDKLAEGANASLTDLQEKGYTVERVKNTWDDENATYRGINAVVCDPNGQRFELQFHTQESFELKNGELHALYEERRTMADDDPRAAEIDEKMIELSAQLERPENIEEVKNI